MTWHGWAITTRFYDNGKVECFMDEVECDHVPQMHKEELKVFDSYVDYFSSKRQAEKFLVQAQNC